MKTKIVVWSVVSILILGLAAAAYWWLQRPQVITLSDGSKLTLVGVDYGKKHAPPAAKAAPAPTAKTPARRGNGSFTTTNDTLVAWVRQEYDSQQYHYFQYFAYDQAGAACVSAGYGSGGNRQGNEVVGLRLDAFPRRQGKFVLRVLENGNGGQELSDQKFVIHNPGSSSFASWTPMPLPSTQEDDDVSVTLTKLLAGAAMPYQRGNADAGDALNKGVQAVFHLERSGQPDTNWEPVAVETSDATGNQSRGSIARNEWSGRDDTAVYQYGLWPDEAAWKLHFEFSQKSNFADSELWTVPNLPLLPGRQMDFYNNRRNNTNTPFAAADLNGFRVKVFPAKVFTNLPPMAQSQGGLTVQLEPALPTGMHLTLVTLTDDQTNDVAFWNSGTSGMGKYTTCMFGLRDLDGVTNLNLTLALHRSRFVDFTVKPEIASDANPR
jgi:hypothetical protein